MLRLARMTSPRRAFGVLIFAALLLGAAACQSANANGQPAPAAAGRTTEAPDFAERIYENGLKPGWEDHGWTDHLPRVGRGETLVLQNYGGWILNRYRLEGRFGGVRLEVRAPVPVTQWLEVRVDSEVADVFPRVRVAASHVRELADGWVEVFIPMQELNPDGVPFTRVVLRAARPLPPPGHVSFDRIGLTKPEAGAEAGPRPVLDRPGQPAAVVVDCRAPGLTISPLIYGIAYSPLRDRDTTHQFAIKPAARRWGGNPTSRFNWELGNAWNSASDYFFMNTSYGHPRGQVWKQFLEANHDRGIATALTVPTLGWVAKDTTSFGFPVAEAGPQADTCPENPKAGNGVGKNGKPLRPGPPTRTSIAAPPAFVGAWVAEIKKLEAARGVKLVHQYILDNEPGLWHDTHRDVHPQPLTYDELLEKTIAYATAIRKADPDALIAGPAEWGWTGYLYSAADAEAGFRLKPDRLAHGDVPLIEWYLQKLRAHEEKTGTRLLDILDLHYYPQGKGIGVGAEGRTDPDTNALRLRSTRSLWDERYIDESWVKEPVALLPRMKGWVDKHAPGLKLSIGEYNFGAERHPSGGLALAEALGRFGQHGLYSAFYWTYPPEGSPAFWAFSAFRNYDGRGARFLDVSLPAESPRELSAFAARSPDGRSLTVMLLNLTTTETFDAALSLKGCSLPASQRVFVWAQDPRGFTEVKAPVGRAYRAPPQSIVVVELALPSAPRQ